MFSFANDTYNMGYISVNIIINKVQHFIFKMFLKYNQWQMNTTWMNYLFL